MSIWATTTSGLESALRSVGVAAQAKQQSASQKQLDTKVAAASNQKTLSYPGSLTNILSCASGTSNNNNPLCLQTLTASGTTTHGHNSTDSSPHSNRNNYHHQNALHIGVAVGAASTVASSIIAHSAGGFLANNNSNNNNHNVHGTGSNSGHSTYQRQSLSQSEFLNYSPPNPNKVSLSS